MRAFVLFRHEAGEQEDHRHRRGVGIRFGVAAGAVPFPERLTLPSVPGVVRLTCPGAAPETYFTSALDAQKTSRK